MVLKILGLIIASGFIGWCIYHLMQVSQAYRYGDISGTEAIYHNVLMFMALAVSVVFIALLGC